MEKEGRGRSVPVEEDVWEVDKVTGMCGILHCHFTLRDDPAAFAERLDSLVFLHSGVWRNCSHTVLVRGDPSQV